METLKSDTKIAAEAAIFLRRWCKTKYCDTNVSENTGQNRFTEDPGGVKFSTLTRRNHQTDTNFQQYILTPLLKNIERASASQRKSSAL
jgi:hypothetical protein